MDFFEVVKNIGSLLGLFLSITSVVGVVAKFQNKRYKELFDEHSKEMRKNVEKQTEEIRKNDKKQTEEITEIKNTLNNLATEFGSFKTEVSSLKTEVGNLKTEVGSLKTEVGNLKTEFDDLKTEVGNLKTEVGNLKTEFDDLKKRSDVDEGFNAEICRNVIKDIYYKYNKTQKIPLYERKMADSLYKIYSEQFHQNSYGQLLYQEICKWEIDTTDKLTM